MNIKNIIIVDLVIANMGIIIYPWTCACIAILLAIYLAFKTRQQVFMWLILSTSLISCTIGNLMPVCFYEYKWIISSINYENLHFAMIIIPVPFIVNWLFINSFFDS